MKKIILIVFLSLFLTSCGKETTLNNNYLNKEDTPIKEENNNNSDLENNIQDTDNSLVSDKIDEGNNLEKNDKIDNNTYNDNNATINYSNEDMIVIESMENINKEVDNLVTIENNAEAQSKAKGIFIMLVDFVFYDGEIKGVTFNSLTEAGKTKVLKLINTIDEKIEKHFPHYKEDISTKTKAAFLKASELIKKGANNIKDFTKEKLGEKYYQDIINSKDEFVLYTKNALSIVTDFSSSLFNSIKDKLSDWYENFKNKD